MFLVLYTLNSAQNSVCHSVRRLNHRFRETSRWTLGCEEAGQVNEKSMKLGCDSVRKQAKISALEHFHHELKMEGRQA